ncbi:unnamed protein product [Absidia cylindrospora]
MLRSITASTLRNVKTYQSITTMAQRVTVSSSMRFFSTPTANTPPPQQQQHESHATIDNSPKQQDVRKSLLQASLGHVAQHGWTMESMAHGAADMGLPSVVHGVFPGGPAGLVDAYLQECQQEFTRLMNTNGNGPEQYWHPQASMTDKVRALTVLRLNMLKPYARRWPEALAILATPSNVPMGFRHLSELVDDIWYYAGDRSPDMNWYTKRASLATIYSATELYMSQDISPEFVETYRFLDRRLSEAEWMDAATSQLGTMLSFGARSFVGAITQSRGH